MADVVLNSAVRSNLRTLQSTTQLLNQTEERLATGKKVNSALDGPANFFTANALDRRATDLNSLLDSVANSIKTLEAADNGITAITEIVEGLKATARAALQSPLAVQEKAAIESDSVANLTATNLIGGGPIPATPATLTASGGFTATGGTLGTAGSITVEAAGLNGGAAVSVALVAGDTAADAATKINAALNAATGGNGGVSVNASSGQLYFTSTSGDEITLAGADATLTAAGFVAANRVSADGEVASVSPSNEGRTLTVKDRNGADKTLTFSATGINTLEELNEFFEKNNVALNATVSVTPNTGKLKVSAENAIANSAPAAVSGTATGATGMFKTVTFSPRLLDEAAAKKRANFADDFNESMKEINTIAKDANYNGVNLLMGDELDVVFNEDGSSKLNVRGVQFDAAGIGLSSIATDAFYDSSSVQTVLDRLESAFATIEQQSSKFGSQLQIVQTREVFTKDMIGTLEDGAHILTAADTNEEAANLATLQTRQQLIVTSLSISTQQESAVLQLLR